MKLASRIADFIRICLLDKEAIKRVSNDNIASNIAVILIFLSILLNSLLNPLNFGIIKLSFVNSFVSYLVMIIIILLSFHILAKLFGGKSMFYRFLRPIGSSFILDIIVALAGPTFELFSYGGIILTSLSSIWTLLIFFFVIKEVYRFKIGKTVALLIIDFLILIGLMILVTTTLLIFFPETIEGITGVESNLNAKLFQKDFFDEIKNSKIDRTVFLKPTENLTYAQLEELTKTLKTKMELTGYPFQISINSENFIVIETSKKLLEKQEFKDLIRKHSFEARIGENIVFKDGRDIEYVCTNTDCAGIDKNYGCFKSQTNWTCRFKFPITLSRAAAKRQEKITANLTIISEYGNSYLSEPLVMYLDGMEIDKLNIGEDLKGEYITQTTISGSGQGINEEEAIHNTLANMKKLQTILATGSLPMDLEIVRIE